MRDSTVVDDAPIGVSPPASGGWSIGETIEILLKRRSLFFERVASDPRITREVPTLLTIAFLAAMPVGAILGSYAGGWHILYVALKVPLLLLLSLTICYLGFWVSALYVGLDLLPGQVATLCVGSMAITAIVLLGLAPLLWLVIPSQTSETSYHLIALTLVAIFGVAGLVGTWQLIRGLRVLAAPSQHSRRAGVWTLALGWIALYAVVGSQLAWVLRPWLLHPWTRGGLPFIRDLDISIFEAVWRIVGRLIG
ncbi:MAG: hypothetical protein KC609_07395 [Myxococcales bacterium]|nr:hypothetical protein [Myxococcales bacterium]